MAIKDIQFLDGSTQKGKPKSKETVLDLKLLLSNKEYINVEIQASFHKGFIPRILYYWSSLYGEGLERGKDYTQLTRTYSLVFTDFNLLRERKDFINSFTILSEKPPHFPLTNHLNITIVELAKFETEIKKLNGAKDYLCYILKKSHELTERECEQLSRSCKEVKIVMDELKTLSEEDVYIRRVQEAREKERRDVAARLDDALEEGLEMGLEKGRTEGLEKKLKEVVLRMKAKGHENSLIEEATGLSQSEIEKIKT